MSMSEAECSRDDNATATAIWDRSQNPEPAGLETPENEQVEPAVDATPGDTGTSQPGIDSSTIEEGSPSRPTPLADRAEYLNRCYEPQQPPAPQRSAVQRTSGLAELAVQLVQRTLAKPSKARSLTSGAQVNTGALENAFETENIGPGKAGKESSQRRSALAKAGVSAAEPQAVSQRQPHNSSAAALPTSGNQGLLGLSACAAKGFTGPLLSDGQIPSPSAKPPSLGHGRAEEASEPGAVLVPVSLAASESPWRRRRLGSFANHGASRSNAAMDAPAQHCTLHAACQLPTVGQMGVHRAYSKRSPASSCRAAESVSALNEDLQHSESRVTDGGASGVVGAAGGAPEQLAAADTPGEGTH